MMNADGTEVTRLTYSPLQKLSPDWSPDGLSLLYVASDSNAADDWDQEIYLLSITDSTSIQLTQNSRRIDDLTPTWFNESQFIYASSGAFPFYVLVLKELGRDTHNELIRGLDPALSPNGQELLFTKFEVKTLEDGRESFYQVINKVSVDDLLLGKEEGVVRLSELEIYTHSPQWSPDGQYIVFVMSGDGNSELFVMNSDGSNPIQLTFTTANEQHPDWAP